jgi:hypothetical protein
MKKVSKNKVCKIKGSDTLDGQDDKIKSSDERVRMASS